MFRNISKTEAVLIVLLFLTVTGLEILSGSDILVPIIAIGFGILMIMGNSKPEIEGDSIGYRSQFLSFSGNLRSKIKIATFTKAFLKSTRYKGRLLWDIELQSPTHVFSISVKHEDEAKELMRKVLQRNPNIEVDPELELYLSGQKSFKDLPRRNAQQNIFMVIAVGILLFMMLAQYFI